MPPPFSFLRTIFSENRAHFRRSCPTPGVRRGRHYIRLAIKREHVMLTAAGQAFQQLFTPPFRAVLIKCVGFTIGLLVALIVGIEWTFSHFVQWPGWIEKTIEWLGGLALVV